jgi:hypothetical protein
LGGATRRRTRVDLLTVRSDIERPKHCADRCCGGSGDLADTI